MNLRSGIEKLASKFSFAYQPIQLKMSKQFELKVSSQVFCGSVTHNEKTAREHLPRFLPSCYLTKSGNLFTSCNSASNISNAPLPIIKSIIEPNLHKKKIELPVIKNLNSIIELPCEIQQEKVDPSKNIISKKAVHMIRIRRKKMKKHKWKKMQKRMKFEFAKVRQKREMAKEMVFQTKLKSILKEGETFSAEEYLNNKLKVLDWTPPVTRARGRLAPNWVIKQELERKEYSKIINDRVNECLKGFKN